MIPGEMLIEAGEIEMNTGRATACITVANSGDRPIQVGSHFHFYEVNPGLRFDRASAYGMRLDIAAGTAVRFEPGQERSVTLVAFAGDRIVYGFNGAVMGPLKEVMREGMQEVMHEAVREPTQAPTPRPVPPTGNAS